MQSDKKARIGFTLIETLVAVAVLLGAIAGPVALVGHALFSTPFSRNDLIAYNLAQEGIELVRTIRDNNILCASLGGTTAFNNSTDTSGAVFDGYYVINADDDTTMTCRTHTIVTPLSYHLTEAACKTPSNPMVIDSNGMYSAQGPGTLTPFNRCLQICSPAHLAPCFGVSDGDIPTTDQMEIISTVSWTERGAPKSIMLRDRLYNWE